MKKIILFVNKRCHHYIAARDYLLKRNIIFEEKDIQNPEVIKEILNKKIRTVPCILVDEKIITWNDKTELSKVINGSDRYDIF